MSVIIEDIIFNYDNFNLSVELEIASGEFLSILGPSGSGKTTLLRLLAGFQNPEKGRILLSGRDITNLPTASRNIGMVFQDYALFPHLDVYHNISYGLKTLNSVNPASKKMSRAGINAKVTELLELVSLSGYAKRSIDELSGGEKQRVALARAIAPEPELLLFDEPLSALDVKLRKSLRREIKKIQQRIGFTAVYVTHDQEEAMSISDRIAVMNGGRITQTGSPEELYNEPADFFTADFIGIMNRLTHPEAVMFRPESCTVVSADSTVADTAGLHIEAIATSAEYSGGQYICEAATTNGESVVFYSSIKFEPGTKLFLQISRSEIKTCC
ncbi:MAG: ABC transporter ATP-binding protein [Spirochaetales bacterium]|uniref:ABC transporter ATP-binding protein n=1 Tax=Candidatus Thalassospirochaeta sargassi TaxID=3119039 RepID=A0AAJ1IJZ6_9SPIO|nr:ABC transporter ATP-binding protein [Spirochaetales bacterium]